MTSIAAVHDEEYVELEKATEVFEAQLETLGAWGKEEIDQLADAWEVTHGRPLWRDNYETIVDFRARASRFKGKVEQRTYFIPKNEARERLSKLREIDPLSIQQQNEVNDLERLLDEPLTDFTTAQPKPPADNTAAVSQSRYIRIQAEDEADKTTGKRERRTWKERIALVEKESDLGTLQLVVTQDEHEKVRAAAERRLAQIEVTGR